MRLSDIQLFHAVYEAGSFTGAAHNLDLPPASISRKITKLENNLGVCLFQRTTRSLHITDVAKHFYKRTKEIQHDFIAVCEEIKQENENFGGKIRIQLIPESKVIITFLHKFQQKHPQVILDLIVSGHNLNLIEHGIDMAIKVGAQQDSSFIYRKLAFIDHEIVAAPAYIKASGSLSNMEELTHHNCLLFRKPDGTIESSWATSKESEVKISGNLIADDVSLIQEAALLGQGIACLPTVFCERHIQKGDLIKIFPSRENFIDGICLIYSRGHAKPPRVKALIHYLTETIRQDPDYLKLTQYAR